MFYINSHDILILREKLGYCDTMREASLIVGAREVLVDGKPALDVKQIVGLMDVVSIPKTKEHYRILIDKLGKLILVKIKPAEAKTKIVRIENKTTVPGGKLQLNLHDGRNILIDKDEYKTGDVLKIEVPSQKIVARYPMEQGAIVLITSGRHKGEIATLEDYNIIKSSRENEITFKEGFSTTRPNVFVVGRDKPEITIPEASAL